ncbi:DUF5753 domain-containing protein [Streptomyces sp. XD-27]|uniref:DUF5753 domain-containing protein n=1 Tax=Streptomyces sp. XD-27 TaxID=3062779 RepID=UPI0026F477AF|nr:DUF5753 domain-containing protein [Streptomyces sp. XD-27]WKX70207.1 DUF5753 domain-containing protein [Streptomyces sp. XD-27]
MAQKTYEAWQPRAANGLRPLQEALIQEHQSVRRLRGYMPSLVPGLLQTRGYATAVMGGIIAFKGIKDDTEAAVAARMQRQQILHEEGREFGVVMEEWVLRARIGDTEVMADQLGHLLSALSLPGLSLGIIPMSAHRERLPAEAFWIQDDVKVTVELTSGSLTVTESAEIETYARTHAALAKMAVYDAHARALIEDARAALG